MGIAFTAIDFETANGFRGSACAVGLVRVREGVVVDTFYATMRPPEGFDRFDPKHTLIHGITADEVAQRPRFAEIFPAMVEFIGADSLVAHNAAFDREVIESGLEVSGMDAPRLEFYCSVQLSRAHYRLASHALPFSCAEAGYNLVNHHFALEDARAAAAIVVDISQRTQIGQISDLYRTSGLSQQTLTERVGPPRRLSLPSRQAQQYPGYFDARRTDIADEDLPDLMRWQDEGKNLEPNLHADQSSWCWGQHVVFTGLLSMPRSEAKRRVAAAGASTGSKVSYQTTVMVIGDNFRHTDLVPDVERSSQAIDSQSPLGSRKAQDALARRRDGQSISLLTETEFFAIFPAV